MIAAAVPYILQGISALGGIFGKKKKYMDAETLRALYGPQAIGKDTQEISNQILNSPYGQQLMAQAAEAGQGLQTEMNSRAAGAGLDASSGGESGASTFATAAGTQAQTGLERQTRSGIYQAAMPIAADLVAGRMQAGLMQQGQQNADPSLGQRVGAAAGQVAASIPAPGPTMNTTAPVSSLALQRVVPDTMSGAPQLPYSQGSMFPNAVAGAQAPDQFSVNPKNRMRAALSGRAVKSAGMFRSLMGG